MAVFSVANCRQLDLWAAKGVWGKREGIMLVAMGGKRERTLLVMWLVIEDVRSITMAKYVGMLDQAHRCV